MRYVFKAVVTGICIGVLGVQALHAEEQSHARRAWMLAPPSEWAAHKPFGNNFERLPEGPLKEILEAMREVDAQFGPGAIVLYGGTVRDLFWAR